MKLIWNDLLHANFRCGCELYDALLLCTNVCPNVTWDSFTAEL